MKKFEINLLAGKTDVCLIFSVDYRSPLEFIDDIENELRSVSSCKKIIFDLLLSNGMNSNRYFEAYFDGCSLINIKKCREVDTEIKDASTRFYRRYPSLLDNSVLVNQQKFLTRSGYYS